jgi:hypothetical protein
VDDRLRFREGDDRASLVVRTVLGALWFPVSYVARFYTVVLIEPGFNPIKAPVSYLAAKVMLPLSVTLTAFLVSRLSPVLSRPLAYALVLPTVWLLPDAFGFLFWETKENWGLYRANRRRLLGAVAIGPHGETMKALLLPGFHSGTVPRLYRRLRREERDAYQTRTWGRCAACRHDLDEISRVVGRFVSRELLAILRQGPGTWGERVSVAGVRLAVNRVGVELGHADWPGQEVEIEFELRNGWLVAGIGRPGWLEHLGPGELRAFTTALVSLYKLAGVEVVREQVQANLPAPAGGWDVTPEGLSLHLGRQGPDVTYDLHDPAAPPPPDAPAVDPRRLVFAWSPVGWQEWLRSWETDRNGQGKPEGQREGQQDDHPGLGRWDRELLPPALVPRIAGASPAPPATGAAEGVGAGAVRPVEEVRPQGSPHSGVASSPA